MHTGVQLWFVSLLCSSLRLFTCTAADRTQIKNSAQYHLTIEQIVKNNYPVPSDLADVFRSQKDE